MIKEMTGKKIGVMGGTFDPIHYGHLMLAEQIRTAFSLDYVIFVPVGKPSHKSDAGSANKMNRYLMAELATSSNPYFYVSDLEIKKEGKSYTIETIQDLKRDLNVNDMLYFITGADSIVTLETWKSYKALSKLVTFIGATRPGVDTEYLYNKIDCLKNELNAEIEVIFIPALDISSTDIRSRVKSDKSIKYLLPESVESFIFKKGLYR